MFPISDVTKFRKDILLLGILIFLPIYLVYSGIKLNLFSLSIIVFLSILLASYYIIFFKYIKNKYIKCMALILLIPIYFIYLLFFYSFIFNKNYTWEDVNVNNFKKPLILWLEAKLENSNEEKMSELAHISEQQTSHLITDNFESETELTENYEDEYSDEEEIQSYDEYDSYGEYESENKSGYHVVDGYTRSDGVEVDSYIRGNPDGVEENNIEYMRDHGDRDGLDQAYASWFN